MSASLRKQELHPAPFPAYSDGFEFFTVWIDLQGKATRFPMRFTRPDVMLETVRRLNDEEEQQEERQGFCEGRYYVWSEPSGERTRV